MSGVSLADERHAHELAAPELAHVDRADRSVRVLGKGDKERASTSSTGRDARAARTPATRRRARAWQRARFLVCMARSWLRDR